MDSDGERLADLRVVAMQESLERIGRFDEDRARARFLSTFSAECTRHIEADGDRVGFVVITRQPDHFALDHLYIDPARQGDGIGSIVLDQLSKDADTAGLAIRVGALKQSDSNRFYLRHGFEFVDEREFDNDYVRWPSSRRSNS